MHNFEKGSHMKRLVSAAVAALVGAAVLAAAAVAAVAPGTYKGNLYTGATKGAAATPARR